MSKWQNTADIPDSFFRDILDVANRLQCTPLDLVRPLMNESGLSFKAHNPVGDAAGIFQAMPNTLRNLGFQGDWHDFTALDADRQLPWLEKYYAPATGRLVNATAVYMWTMCPAFISHASNPAWVICAEDGHSDGGLSEHMCKLWYVQNKGLDKTHDGKIDVGDLSLSIVAADQGDRWNEIVSRIAIANVQPEPVGKEDDAVAMCVEVTKSEV